MSRPRKRKPSSPEHEGPDEGLAGAETNEAHDEGLSPEDEQLVRAVAEAADAIVAQALADADALGEFDEREDSAGELGEFEDDEGGISEPPGAGDELGVEPAEATTDAPAASAEPEPDPAVALGYELREGDEAPDRAEHPAAAEPDEVSMPGEDTEDRPGLEKAPPVSVSAEHLKSVIESLLFVSDKPLPANRIARIAQSTTKEVQRLLDVLIEEYRGRGVELVEVAGGFQFRSAAANAPFVRELVARKPVRLTRAQIETLAMIAYRQPITRPEVDEIRGVDSGSALKVLAEKNLVKIIGRKDEPGRPLLYGTTPHFLEFFGLASLSDLPTLREYSELNEESRALFQRRTGEAIEGIADIAVERREYSEEELDEAAAELEREVPARRAEQLELDGAVDASSGDQGERSPDDDDDDEDAGEVSSGAPRERSGREAATDEEQAPDEDESDEDEDESDEDEDESDEDESDEDDDESDDDDDDESDDDDDDEDDEDDD